MFFAEFSSTMKKRKIKIMPVIIMAFFGVLLVSKISQFFINAQTQYKMRKWKENIGVMQVARSVICQQIVNSKPQPKPLQIGNVIPAPLEAVYCYSEIKKLPDPSQAFIVHTWYHANQKYSEKIIPLDPEHLGVYSSCRLAAADTGFWSVDISLLDNTLLTTLDFKVIPVNQLTRG
jgi:hypothetical protein